MNELVDNYIKHDQELIGLIQSQLDTDDFHDDNLLLLAQDILYQCFDKKLIHTRNYWIFQANPDIFDVFSALKENKVNSWLINQNKGNIRSGDKVILWVTGEKSGCYALAEISDNPKEVGLETDDHFWKTTKPSGLRAPITITHNYIDNPILKSEIMNIEELKNLKAGKQGTNLKATKEEFEFLLKLRPSNSKNFAKNLILYGPPGTGKTFNSKIKAQEIDGTSSNSFITFHQSFSYEQFVEGISVCTDKGNKEIVIYDVKGGIFKKVCVEAIGFDDFENFLQEYDDKEKRKEYLSKREPVVLIIDEINRGNISKIFGELITLLEEDKRLGEDKREMHRTLPYSGEQFGVPPNLYIIGTMNTADRSLVQLDTALRRRFDFEEMMPKYHHTDEIIIINEKTAIDELKWPNSGIIGDKDLSIFLYKLNEKICKEYDREHQIGHSFLMKVNTFEELRRAWENRIMPLLQEYFYADYGNLAKVIGESEYLAKPAKDNEKWKLKMKASEGKFENEFAKVYEFAVYGKNANQKTNGAEEQDEEIEA
ncbi:MAG: EVE domain-containing protein [Candidatus Kapabacteria bacterium]|nr:EVE domain-containing protein [Candidatus Kapabacteria bacterium]